MIYERNTMYGEWIDVELRKNTLWVVIGPLNWVRPTGEVISLSPFLITDFATTPRILRKIYPRRSDRYDLAAAFHDDVIVRYHNKGYPNRAKSHRIFNEIARYYDTPTWQRVTMYKAIRAYGVLRYIRYNVWESNTDYSQYFGWKLTPDEKYKYYEIRQHSMQFRYNALFNIEEMPSIQRRQMTYDEFVKSFE